jgi:hypothetical protein
MLPLPRRGSHGRARVVQKLDQSLSRAKFNADLATMSRDEKNIAIQRLMLPDDDVRAMPPQRFRTITEEERAKMIELLKQ